MKDDHLGWCGRRHRRGCCFRVGGGGAPLWSCFAGGAGHPDAQMLLSWKKEHFRAQSFGASEHGEEAFEALEVDERIGHEEEVALVKGDGCARRT